MLAAAINRDEALLQIQQRALWLAVQMVDHANQTRAQDGIKVGGHMAPSASTVTMTDLYREYKIDAASIRAASRQSLPHSTHHVS